MGSLKGKTPGNTYTKLAIVQDPDNNKYVLLRDKGDGNDEVLPLWTAIDSTTALSIKNVAGTSTLSVDTLSNVVSATNLNISADPSADRHATPKSYVDKNNYKFQKYIMPTGTVVSDGISFSLDSTPLDGSVQVIINGVYYLSNNVQTDDTSPTDFYTTTNKVIIVNKKRRLQKNIIFQTIFFIFYFILPCQRQHWLKTSWFFVKFRAKKSTFLCS